jgi:phage regulator Rha-like protein
MDIVKIKDKECFISSEDLAFLSNNEHRAVRQLIQSHKDALESFGVLTFKMDKPQGKNGGRPSHNFFLNEQQATLLTTFMRNSKIVVDFKKRLVKEFFLMREYLKNQEVARLSGKEIRKSLTDAVQGSGEVERMHGHAYSVYTRLAYSLIGIYDEYKEFKKTECKDSTVKFRDTLDGDVLKRLKNAESLIKPLLDLDKEYGQIKDLLQPLFAVENVVDTIKT